MATRAGHRLDADGHWLQCALYENAGNYGNSPKNERVGSTRLAPGVGRLMIGWGKIEIECVRNNVRCARVA